MRRMRWVAAVLVTVLFIAATPTRPAEAAPQLAATRAAMATDYAAVRTAPSADAPKVETLDPNDVFPVVGTVEGEKVSGNNGTWLETAAGRYVYSALAKPLRGGSRYIDVDKGTHTALAIENRAIVRSVPVVLGQPGWRTPVGDFTITEQVRRKTMDSTVLGIPVDSPGGFSYPIVPYVQYTDGGFAIHGNYWAPADSFGAANSSHGCVGMLPEDARFFWNFASVGTPVYIHD